jgi:hypothetical protein
MAWWGKSGLRRIDPQIPALDSAWLYPQARLSPVAGGHRQSNDLNQLAGRSHFFDQTDDLKVFKPSRPVTKGSSSRRITRQK